MIHRSSLLLTALALASLHGCGPGHACGTARTIDMALDEMCSDDGGAGPGMNACVPSQGTVCTIVGTGVAGLGADGQRGPATQIYLPQDVTIGPDGNPYFLDWNNHLVRKLDANGLVQRVAGTGELSDADATFGADGGEVMPTTAPAPALTVRLNHPTGLEFDLQGRMLIAAWHNSEVKRVDMTTGIMESICGTGVRGYGGDGGPAPMAVLNLPVAVAINPATSEVYIADQANERIRRIDGSGTITSVVGDGMRGFAGDGGPAAMAELNNPVGQAAVPAGRIVFDTSGNLYIADTGNHRVRRVDPSGAITTVAGNGNPGFAGDGGPATMAELDAPADVEIGPDGTLYIADTQNSCVRSVGRDGVIHTVAGQCGTRGASGDGGSPTMALFDRPYGIETDSSGNLYIADTYNQRIRLVCVGNTGRCAGNSGH